MQAQDRLNEALDKGLDENDFVDTYTSMFEDKNGHRPNVTGDEASEIITNMSVACAVLQWVLGDCEKDSRLRHSPDTPEGLVELLETTLF
jgi:hypothetical protein